MLPLWILIASLAACASGVKTLHPRTTCNQGVYVLSARGTDEPSNGSRLDAIVEAITTSIPNSFGEEVNYPASLDFVNSVTTGVLFLNQRLTDYATNCPNRSVVLIGYSQGALVTGIVLAGTNLSNTNYPALNTSIGSNVVAIVNFGDPTRDPGQGFNALGSQGCNDAPPLARKGPYKTAMDFYASRILDFCDGDDPICCGTGHDPIAHVSYFGQNTTDTVVTFVKQQLNRTNQTINGTATTSGSATASATSSSTTASSTAPAGTSAAPSTGSGHTLHLPSVWPLLLLTMLASFSA